MGKIMTIGEPMAMFVANQKGKLKDIRHFQMYIAGAEVNVSVGLSRLGHEVEFVTQLGMDPFGEYILDFLENEQINTSTIQFTSEFPTGFQLKNKDDLNDPEVVYFRKGSAASQLTEDWVEKIDFSDIDIFHVTGILMALNDRTYELIQLLIDKAKNQETIVSFDPNLRPVLWESEEKMISRINKVASKVDYILPGLSEGQRLTSKNKKEEIANYYLEMGVKGVIIKNGEQGAYAKWRDEKDQFVEIETPAFCLEETVDTVGAGDGFAVGILSGLLENLAEDELLERANAIGAIQVSHISDNENLPNREELHSFVDKHKFREEKHEITSGN